MHALEFSMLEVFSAETDYIENCRFLEDLIKHVIKWTCIEATTTSGLFDREFAWMTYDEALATFTPYQLGDDYLTFLEANYPEMFTLAMPSSTWVGKALKKLIVPHIQVPTFIHKMPNGQSPLIKSSDGIHSDKANLVVQGLNLADIHSCQNDSVRLRHDFEQQAHELEIPINTDYLSYLELGMTDFSGFGFYLNRFFLLFRGKLPLNINETVIFPF